eukprot:COSAG01_NODE_71144_length_256_cov_6.585987_1_plen_54_part_10
MHLDTPIHKEQAQARKLRKNVTVREGRDAKIEAKERRARLQAQRRAAYAEVKRK